MSYSLRPGNILRRPARYQGFDDDERNGVPNPMTHNTTIAPSMPTDSADDNLATADNLRSLQERTPSHSPFTSQPVTSPAPAPRPALNADSPSAPPGRRNMANIKNVKSLKRLRGNGQLEKDHDDTPTVRKSAGRPVKVARASTSATASAPVSIYPSERPAAFPSLPTDGPPLEAVAGDSAGHGMRELIAAMEKGDQDAMDATKHKVDDMYNNGKIYPREDDAGKSMWYAQVKERWATNESDAIVTFASLWPSLRQTIIEQIRDEFSGTYYESYLPVRRILNLTESALRDILGENSDHWHVEDDIPRHSKEFHRLYPNEIVDPDEPPKREVVKAIRYLKQQSLPGSLLGEWQTPLPAIEVFRSPTMFPPPLQATGGSSRR
ncbi:hypothetical protein EJ02DRAFT_423884 [Clathrospora elynae]|uniref:Uncharacterized protein n=1 Tax=Clathrospora elynae TaxID=706981 RepID=A0A6A5SLN4_9PLEO|nr:hypothetical protein EJ02DRAFT_423884 [Clathrospora elynae]